MERNTLPLDTFFTSINEKLLLYQQHAKSTTELYRKECADALNKLQEEQNPIIATANRIYAEIMVGKDDQDTHSLAMHESGLDEIEQHYQTVEHNLLNNFIEMADYFNKSSLVSLYGLLESDLRRLCDLLKESFSKRIALKDLSDRDYLISIFSYLDLVIELPVLSLESYVTKFKELQYLRNRIVHNGAEFFKGEKNETLVKQVSSSNGLLKLVDIGESEFQVLKITHIDYLNQYYKLIQSLFHDLLWIIDEKQNYLILISRLANVFGYLSKEELFAHVTKAKQIKNGRQFTIELKSSDLPHTLLCNVTIEHAKTNSLNIVNQVESYPLLDELLGYIDKHSLILRNSLGIFIPSNVYSKVTLTVYQ